MPAFTQALVLVAKNAYDRPRYRVQRCLILNSV